MFKNKSFVILAVVVLLLALWAVYPQLLKLFGGLNRQTYNVLMIYPGGTYKGAVDGFADGLREASRISGKNLNIITKEAATSDQAKSLLGGLMKTQKIDMIYAVTTATTKAVSEIAGTIPIIFTVVGDPIGSGFVKNFAEPGGNITGCTNLSAQLSAKRLEIFKEAFGEKPTKTLRFVFFYNPASSISNTSLNLSHEAVAKLGNITLDAVPVKNKDEVTKALAALKPGVYDGMINAPDGSILVYFKEIAARATALKIPVMAHEDTFVNEGATISYGANFYQAGKQCSKLGDKILNGISPKNISVETPAALELVVSVKKAKEIGFSLPQAFLGKANLLIK